MGVDVEKDRQAGYKGGDGDEVAPGFRHLS